MQQKGVFWIGIAAVAGVALAMACGGKSPSPASPTSSRVSEAANGADAAADGSTLKVNAPALTSPTGGTRLTTDKVTLTFQAVAAKFGENQTFTYRVQLLDAAGALLEEKTGTGLSYAMSSSFGVDTLYRWRVRAELAGAFGPWSTTETFRSLDKQVGYIRGNELYDPLIEGKTVGTVHGPVTWVPGVGVRLDAEESYIEYELPQTLSAGEYSLLATGLGVISRTEDPKLRVMSMREGSAAINDNIYRMTIDKRGNGAVAWRFLTGLNSAGSYIETVGAERVVVNFHESSTYFVKATWGGGVFGVLYREGGVTGDNVYESARAYKREYTPLPHMVFVGSPYKGGDRGEPSSVDGMIVRQVWVSPNPRPSYANQ